MIYDTARRTLIEILDRLTAQQRRSALLRLQANVVEVRVERLAREALAGNQASLDELVDLAAGVENTLADGA